MLMINKIKQNKPQYNLERKTAQISALSSGNVSKYEVLTGKDFFHENNFKKKPAAIKRFKHSPSGKELKKQSSVKEKQQ